MCVYIRLLDDSFFFYHCQCFRFCNNEFVININDRVITYPIEDIYAISIYESEVI